MYDCKKHPYYLLIFGPQMNFVGYPNVKILKGKQNA